MYDGLCAMFAWWMYYVCPVVCPVVGITDLLPPRKTRLALRSLVARLRQGMGFFFQTRSCAWSTAIIVVLPDHGEEVSGGAASFMGCTRSRSCQCPVGDTCRCMLHC